ncbi:MAG: oligosaccharide flippase family protein [Candidatus Bathyarchaeota archaeon]|nr:oligosaccharide flippase family protein [Candidatus Bathyarchaeota archaeon]
MMKTANPQAHVARGATFIFIQGILSSAFGVIYVWFLLHTKEMSGQILFTEIDYGNFAVLSFILTLVSTLGVLALRRASVRHIAQYIAEGKKELASSVVTRVLQVSFVTSAAIVVVFFISAGVLTETFRDPVLTLWLLPMASIFSVLYSQAQGFLQGLQKMRELASIAIVYSVIHYSSAIVLVYSGFGLFGIALSWLVGTAVSCFLSFLITYRSLGFTRRVHKLKPLIAFSLPIYISVVLTFIVGWVDQIIILPIKGTGEFGVYNLAVRAASVSNLVSVATVTSLFPKLSELQSLHGDKSLEAAFKVSTRYAALLGFPVSLMVATLAYPIIVLFATVRYLDAVGPLAIMCIASIPTILGLAIFPTLYTLKRTKTGSSIVVITIICQALFSYFSLQFLDAGLTGVAISRILAALIQFTLGIFMLRSSLKVEFDKEAIWKSAIAAIVMVLSILGLELLRSVIEPIAFEFLVLRLRLLPIYVSVGVIVYVVSLIIMKTFKRQDFDLLHEYLPSRFRRFAILFSHIARIKELPADKEGSYDEQRS